TAAVARTSSKRTAPTAGTAMSVRSARTVLFGRRTWYRQVAARPLKLNRLKLLVPSLVLVRFCTNAVESAWKAVSGLKSGSSQPELLGALPASIETSSATRPGSAFSTIRPGVLGVMLSSGYLVEVDGPM